jgi:hypothetical protein
MGTDTTATVGAAAVCGDATGGGDTNAAGAGAIAGAVCVGGRLGGGVGGNGRTGAGWTGSTLAGSCGVSTITNCGAGPAAFTCSCSVVPGGSACGSCTLMTTSPILRAVSPSGALPTTSASSSCPGLNSPAVAAAAEATTLGSWGWIEATIARACRIRVNAR